MARAEGKDRGLFERPAGSGVWWIRWTDQHGKEHREKAGTKANARTLYQKRKAGALQDEKLPELTRKRPLTVADLVERYREKFEAKRGGKNDKRYALYMTQAFGDLALNELSPADVEKWQVKRQKVDGVAPATVNRAVAFFKWLYNLAIRDGIFEGTNPVGRVKQLRENNSVVRYLTDEEEEALRAACSPDLWLKVEFALLTGLRQGEQFGLKRENLDFRAGTVTVDRSKHGEKRHVPMTDRTREILREVLAKHDSEWVWPGNDPGRPYLKTSAYTALQRACKKAGVKKFRWHDLRHSFCSRLAMGGESLVTIQHLAGHKTITVTQRYAHLSPEHQREAMAKLSRRSTERTATLPLEPVALAWTLRELLSTRDLATLVGELTSGSTGTKTGTAQTAPRRKPLVAMN